MVMGKTENDYDRAENKLMFALKEVRTQEAKLKTLDKKLADLGEE